MLHEDSILQTSSKQPLPGWLRLPKSRGAEMEVCGQKMNVSPHTQSAKQVVPVKVNYSNCYIVSVKWQVNEVTRVKCDITVS